MLRPFAVVCLFTVVACAQKIGEVPKVEPGPKAERGVALEWTSAEGRPYWYRLPKDDKKPCLVVMLHGTGTNHGWSFWNYPIVNGTFRPDDIVVSPDGVTPNGGGGFNFVQNDQDGDQIAGLIRFFRSRFEIDRVYLHGHSQGAFFCYWFGGRHPQLIDGYVAHAGNLLQANHPEEAKSRLGIAILHGRADAVVTVDCAISTEKRMRELGYQKLRLEIVEGLTEQSGHWPLAHKSAELLAWLDSVTVEDAASLLGLAEADLESKSPDLETLVRNAERLPGLIKKSEKDDREAQSERSSRLNARLEAVLRAQLAALDALAADPKAKDHAGWAARVRRLNRAFGDHPVWKKEAKAWVARLKADTQKLERAAKSLSNPRAKSVGRAIEASQRYWLADGFEAMNATLQRLVEQPMKGLDDEDRRAFLDFLKSVEQAESADREAELEVTRSAVRS